MSNMLLRCGFPLILGTFPCIASISFAEPTTQRTIDVDVTEPSGPRDSFWRACIGAGHASVMLHEDNLKQLALVQQEIGFERIRFHGILNDDMGVCRIVDGKPVYEFAKIDQLYDAFLKIKIRPFVEVGFMPKDLASGTKTVFYWKGNVTQPKDYDQWGALIRAFAKHLIDRYGAAEVENWNFEVWNEPNFPSFFLGKQADYFHLYDVTAAAIKSVDEHLRVGGPATSASAWIPEFIGHCCKERVPLDFISTHTYASDSVFDEFGKHQTHLMDKPSTISGPIRGTRRQISASTKPSLPLHYTEWSTTPSSRDPVHDDYFSAAFICEKLKESEGQLQSMSYWTYSDLFEEAGPPPTPFHGGFGLLTREGIRKSSYFAYKYLAQLGAMELADADARSWVCIDRDGTFTALIWDYHLPVFKVPDTTFFRVKRPARPVAPALMRVQGLSPGHYTVTIYRTGFETNDPYTAYLDMGRPKSLSSEQLSLLQKESQDLPESSTATAVNEGHVTEIHVSLRENDVLFVRLRKDK
jgi:xylan 1,4-beta-xylosidase